MRRICSWLLLSVLFATAAREVAVTYNLVRTDGQVLATSEVRPNVGDSYWDAASDVWYTVLSVHGTKAVVGTEAEATAYFRTRNLRIGAGIALSLGLLYGLRRRSRRRRALRLR